MDSGFSYRCIFRRANESCCTNETVMSNTRTSHAAHTNESRCTHKRVMSHTLAQTSHVAHTKSSFHHTQEAFRVLKRVRPRTYSFFLWSRKPDRVNLDPKECLRPMHAFLSFYFFNLWGYLRGKQWGKQSTCCGHMWMSHVPYSFVTSSLVIDALKSGGIPS